MVAPQRTTDVSSRLIGPVYGVGLLFVVLPIVDTLAQVWPPSPGNPSWRYGLVGIGANYLISIAFGMLLLSLAAGYMGRRRTLRWLTGANAAFAAIALLATLAFVLDALQVRAGIPRDNAQALRLFKLGAEKAVFKYLATVIVLLWLAVSSWRGAKDIPQVKGADDVPKLVSKQAESR